jgi:hypothetical protein
MSNLSILPSEIDIGFCLLQKNKVSISECQRCWDAKTFNKQQKILSRPLCKAVHVKCEHFNNIGGCCKTVGHKKCSMIKKECPMKKTA